MTRPPCRMSAKNETGEALFSFLQIQRPIDFPVYWHKQLKQTRLYNTSKPLAVMIFIQRESLLQLSRPNKRIKRANF